MNEYLAYALTSSVSRLFDSLALSALETSKKIVMVVIISAVHW